eukprot:GEMP01036467.1.p1 GENE.GEMP01036467.1~~GEMP01036467.1.p1  ORF type:complete len:639 (+),score=105.63 GEMP01036467.1:69-1919(+)
MRSTAKLGVAMPPATQSEIRKRGPAPQIKNLFQYKGSVDFRREALLSWPASLSDMSAALGPITNYLVITTAAIAIVYVYYSFLQFWAHELHLSSFSNVWLSVPIIFTFLYLAVINIGLRILVQQNKRHAMRGVFEMLAVYNICQTAFNAYMFWQFVLEVLAEPRMSWWGNTMETTATRYRLSFLIWVHYNNKYIELLDTCFILVRRRWSQISGLHVLVRILLLWSWYLVCRFGCGGDAYFGAMMHSFTQIFTYGYYTVALLRIPCPWKFLVIRLHCVQFVTCAVHALYILCYVDYNPWLAAWQLVLMIFMLVLFTDFHYQKSDMVPVERPQEPRIVFSFDSSGWHYVYFFGVAKYIETYLRDDVTKPVAYSGSSGGGLVACALCAKVDISDLCKFVISCRGRCRVKVWEVPRCAIDALTLFLKEENYQHVKTNLKILATRVSLRKPPFFMGEILQHFESREHLAEALVASSNVPLAFGICPKRVKHSTGRGYYFDGMFWSQTLGFVPWRGFTSDDEIIRFSTYRGMRNTFLMFPPTWALFPPPESVLRGMFAYGYIDAQQQFAARHEFHKPNSISKEMEDEADLFIYTVRQWWRRRFIEMICGLFVIGIVVFFYPS